MPFAVRRARVRVGQLVAMALVVAGVVGGIALFETLSARAFDAGVGSVVAEADPTAQGVVFDAPLAEDAAAQDEELRAAIAESFAGVEVDVARSVQARAFVRASAEGAESTVGVWADDAIADRATLVDGAWPTSAAEVALGARAAERLGAAVGDDLLLDSAPATVVGLWEADDPADPAWFGDPSVVSGIDDGVVGPVVGLEERVASLARTPHARWTIVPVSVTVATGPVCLNALDQLDLAVSVLDPGGALGVRVDGDLDDTIRRALTAVASARGALVVPLLVFVAIGAITLGVLANALARTRRDEVLLLRARGSSARSLWAASLVESAIVAAVGALLGAGAVIGFAGADAGAALRVAGIGGGAAALVLTFVGAAGRLTPTARNDAGRSTALALVAPLVLVGLAAGLAVAQLIAVGGVTTASGRLDPLAAAAGGLVLVALGLVAALAVGPVALGAAALARSGRGLTVVLALRRLARGAGALTAGVLCITLAAGSLALAGALAVTAQEERANALTAAVGSDVRGIYDVQESVDAAHSGVHADELRSSSGIDAVFPALARTSSVGRERVDLIAAPAEGMAALPGLAASTAAAFEGLPVGTAIGHTGDTLRVAVTATATYVTGGAVPSAEVNVWSADVDGAVRQTRVGVVPADGETRTLDVPLTDPDLLAIDVSLDAAGPPLGVLGQIASSITVSDAAGEIPLPGRPLALTEKRTSTRVILVDDVPDQLPAVITSALATRVDAAVGAVLSVRVGSATKPTPIKVLGIVDALPGIGTAPGVVLDLGSVGLRSALVGGAFAAAGELWITTDDVVAASDSIRAVATDPVMIATPASVGTDPVLIPAVVLFAALATAAAVLAVIGFAVVTRPATPAGEALALRAFGFGGVAQRRVHALRTTAAAVFALVAGVLGGLVTAAVVLPVLVPALVGVA